MSKFTVLIEKFHRYRFLKNVKTNKFYLKVVCGGIGTYERVIELNENEIRCYEAYGDSYIESLARKVMKTCEFDNRHVNIEFD